MISALQEWWLLLRLILKVPLQLVKFGSERSIFVPIPGEAKQLGGTRDHNQLLYVLKPRFFSMTSFPPSSDLSPHSKSQDRISIISKHMTQMLLLHCIIVYVTEIYQVNLLTNVKIIFCKMNTFNHGIILHNSFNVYNRFYVTKKKHK